jgi:hypothetical protein
MSAEIQRLIRKVPEELRNLPTVPRRIRFRSNPLVQQNRGARGAEPWWMAVGRRRDTNGLHVGLVA